MSPLEAVVRGILLEAEKRPGSVNQWVIRSLRMGLGEPEVEETREPMDDIRRLDIGG
jgi:hypothetical protein